ncbi:MAG TPA: prenyltransferase [Salinivirga sp.]|uniref:prenyltransferase n=1 Tax=Salinivirga sp. TaxID=1970192 RepID=UPI002B48102B|nr:prenyltransferase [Salinivirga sp.]HKK59476.1 prenyltransferase [Salinivirga sp.]
MTDNTAKRSAYILQIKYLLFSASIIPALISGVLVYGQAQLHLFEWFLVILGLLLGQAGGDYLYYYFTNNHTDQRDAHTKIFAGWQPLFARYFKSAKTPFYVGLAVLFVNVFVLYYFYLAIGWKILAFAAVGGLIALTFTFLMMKGFKEVTVFVTFGPLSMAGAYLALTGQIAYLPVWVSIPVGLLITLVAYLKGARIKTSVDGQHVVSIKNNLIDFLTYLAFVSLIALVVFKVLPVHSLLGLLGIVPAILMRKKLASKSASIPQYLSATVQSIFAMIVAGIGIMTGWILQYHFTIF